MQSPIRVGIYSANDTLTIPHRLDSLLDDFPVEYVSVDSLNQSARLTFRASIQNLTFSHPELYLLVRAGLADTVHHAVNPNLMLTDYFTSSNAFVSSDVYLLHAKANETLINVNGIMANIRWSVFTTAIGLILLTTCVHFLAFRLLSPEVNERPNWWTLLMNALPCFNCQGVVTLAHQNKSDLPESSQFFSHSHASHAHHPGQRLSLRRLLQRPAVEQSDRAAAARSVVGHSRTGAHHRTVECAVDSAAAGWADRDAHQDDCHGSDAGSAEGDRNESA